MSSIEVVTDFESLIEGAKASLKVSKMRYEEATKELVDAKSLFEDAKAELQKISVSRGSVPCKCASLDQACKEENSKLQKKLSDFEGLETKMKEELNDCKAKSQRLEIENKSLEGELKEFKVEGIRMDTENLKLREFKEKAEKELKEIRSELEKLRNENQSLVEKGVGSSVETIYENFINSKGVKRGNPIVFFAMKLHGIPAGRVVMELYADTVPCKAEIFRKLCTGEMIIPGTNRPIGYKGTEITYFYMYTQVGGGNLRVNNAAELYSIYGDITYAERVSRPHTEIGDMFLNIAYNVTHGCSFAISFGSDGIFDGRFCKVGRVIQGIEVLKNYNVGLPNGQLPLGTFVIAECGQLF